MSSLRHPFLSIDGTEEKNYHTMSSGHSQIQSQKFNKMMEENESLGQFFSDYFVQMAGSWSFIFSMIVFIALWVYINSCVDAALFDQYPYILLNLMLSFIAAYSTPMIMISQQTHSRIERIKESSLQEKVDQIRISQLVIIYENLKEQCLLLIDQYETKLNARVSNSISKVKEPIETRYSSVPENLDSNSFKDTRFFDSLQDMRFNLGSYVSNEDYVHNGPQVIRSGSMAIFTPDSASKDTFCEPDANFFCPDEMRAFLHQPINVMTDGEEKKERKGKMSSGPVLDCLDRFWRSMCFRGSYVDEDITFGEHVATLFSESVGSWTFVLIQTLILSGWITWNLLSYSSFDPFPFVLLNLCLSTQSAFAAPLVMMAANRLGQIEGERNMDLHANLDHVRLRQITAIGDCIAVQTYVLSKMKEL